MADNQTHVDEIGGEVYLQYVGYFKKYGKKKVTPFTFAEFQVILKSFYDFTLDAFVSGDLEKPDGTRWESSQHAFEAWQEHHGLNSTTAGMIFRSNDDIEAYS